MAKLPAPPLLLKFTVPAGVLAPVPLVSVTVAVQLVALVTATGFGLQATVVPVPR